MQRANLSTRAGDQPWQVRVAWGLASLAGFVLFWEVMALLIAHRHLPGPGAVFTAMMREFSNGQLLFHIGMTLYRVIVAFVLAMLIGSAIGIVMGRNARIDHIFDGWLILFLNLPALVIIFLCYVWLGFTEVAAIVAVAVNSPADRGGLEANMVLLDVAGRPVASFDDLKAARRLISAAADSVSHRDLSVRVLKGAKIEHRLLVGAPVAPMDPDPAAPSEPRQESPR